MPSVFVSDAIEQERLVFDLPAPMPAGHGWSGLAARYRASLAACGLGVVRVARPEIYQTAQARRVCGAAPGDWHLAVKPAAHLRPFHGLPNVFVSDGLSPVAGASPDPLRLLRLADVVICEADPAAERLREAGLRRVVTLPPAAPGGQAAFAAGLARVLALLAERPA